MMTPQAAIAHLEGLKFPIDQDLPAWKAENNEALDLAIAALKEPVIDDEMIKRAVMAYGEVTKVPFSRNGIIAAITAALEPFPKFEGIILGVDMAAPNVE